MKPLYIDSLWGLGDNIFTRPFVRAASTLYDVYLGTPWPELFEDLPVRFVYRHGTLRTQMKNIAAQPPARWSMPPLNSMRTGRLTYRLVTGSIPQEIERCFQPLGISTDPFVFDLPDFGPCPIMSDKPIAVIRPATVRTEWCNMARNPRPEYLDAIARRLGDTHTVVSVADLADGREWMLSPAPRAHVTLHKGELKVKQLLALVRDADLIIGGVGWIVPAALAAKRKCFVVLGGHGGHNAPEKITDSRMDLSRIGFAMPERFCRCTDMRHACDKTIPDLDRQFSAWATRVGLRCSAAWPTAA